MQEDCCQKSLPLHHSNVGASPSWGDACLYCCRGLQLFSEYSCPWVQRAFGLNFSQFMDTLNVFGLGSGADLVLRYPGANEELICE